MKNLVVSNSYSTLEHLLSEEIAALGGNFELLGLEVDNHTSPRVLRVYADVLNEKLAENVSELKKGITLDDCAKISYHLTTFLRVVPDFQFNNYVLEVSSPGLERRLFSLLQFEQHLGKQIKLHLAQSLNGRSNFIGVLRSVDHALNKVVIYIDGQDCCFDFDNIAKANLVYRKV